VTDSNVLRVSWRVVALASLLFNLAAIVTVATVAAVTDADALSTVALALAIIAFTCQLIIYSVQTWQSGEQLRQARDLNARTTTILTEVRTRIEGTHQMVSVQHQELLHLAALKARSNLRKDAADSTDDRVSVTLAEAAVHSVAVAAGTEDAPIVDGRPEVVRRSPRWTYPIEWPSPAVAERLLGVLRTMDLDETSLIFALSDDIDSDEAGGDPGLTYRQNLDSPLVDAGLLTVRQRADAVGGLRDVAVLTDDGRAAGRLLLAPLPAPPYLAEHEDEIVRMRERIDEHELEMVRHSVERLAVRSGD
jgi:hypothetical protein